MKYEERLQRCPECGQPVRKTSVYCPHCGYLLPKAVSTTCHNCGASLEPGARFCSQCAAPVGSIGPDVKEEITKTLSKFAWWPSSDWIQDLCGSGACLVLTVSITVMLVCRVLFQFNISNLISNIPMVLICIGCWMCFYGGRKNELTPSGFSLISGTLTFLTIISCIGSALGCLLGVVLIFFAEETQVIGLVLLIIFGISFFLIWKYWSQLRLSAHSAKRVLQSGTGRVTASMYNIVVLYIGTAANLISLVNNSNAERFYYNLYDYIYEFSYYLPYELQNMLYSLLGILAPPSNSLITILGNLAAVAVPLCAGLILQKLRKEQRIWKC